MTTTLRIQTASGELLGIFPSSEKAAVREFVDQNPGAVVKVVVSTDNRCAKHSAFEADNCPSCGTSRTIRQAW